MATLRLAIAALLLAGVTSTAVNVFADWPEFRGPGSRGYVAQGSIPSSWTDDDYVWRHETGSRDVGSPAIIDGKIFYLASRPNESKIIVESLDLRSGEPIWTKEFTQRPHHLHTRNTMASSTPAVDEEHVYVAWSDPQHTNLVCLDHEGNQIWKRDFGSWQSSHGFGTSPRIFGSMVLLFNSQQASQLDPGQSPGRSRVVAVDRKTGEPIWESELTATRTCYGVPAIYQPESGGPPQIIDANTGDGMFGLDAKTGDMLWNTEVFRMRCCSSPMIIDDIAIASSGSGGGGNHLVAVRIPKPGEQPQEVYRIERNAPYVPTPVVKNDLMFLIDDKIGVVSCFDARTGNKHWSNRLGGTYGASPVVIGDKLLVINLSGEATVLRASDQFEVLGEVDLGGYVGATPAYSNGRLVLRVGTELLCLAPGEA